jgi:TetR/AcrR family acrAB operon transcriptional repressor
MMKRTKEEADVTRQQLLESALRVFSEKGYAATRLSDIAVAADVTRGAIYHHFGNKKELFIALFKDRADPYFQIVSEILSSDLSPLEKIRKLMITMLQNFEEDELFQADERLRMQHSSPLAEINEIKDILFENIKRTLTLSEKVVQAGQKVGEIRNDLDARDIVVFLFSFIRGVACILEGGLLKQAVVGKAEMMTDLFFEGIRSK